MTTIRRMEWLLAWCLAWAPVGFPAFAQAPAFSEEAYQAVQGAFLREDFAGVVRQAQGWLAQEEPLTPQRARVWMWKILSLDRLERTSEALRELDRVKAQLARLPVAQANALWPEVLFWEGELSRHAARWGRAQAAYDRLVAFYPASSWRAAAHFGWGIALFQQRAYDEAAGQFREAARRASGSALARDARLSEVACALQRQQFDDALRLIQEAAASELSPEQQAQARVYQGQALTGLNRFEEASGVFQQALAIDPASQWTALAYFGRGWSEFQQQRCAESLEALHGYLARGGSASRPEVLLMQGRCALERGDVERGMRALDAVITAQPPSDPFAVEARLGLAQALQRQREFSRASALLRAAVGAVADPLLRDRLRLQLGSAYLAQGALEQARAQFAAVEGRAAPQVRQAAQLGLGDAWMVAGDAEQAMRYYEEARQAAPESDPGLLAAYRLGRTKLRAGAADEAAVLFEFVIQHASWPPEARGPNAPLAPAEQLTIDARLALALAELAAGRAEEARAQLIWVQEQEAWTPQAIRSDYYLALLSAQTGAAQDARARCERLLASAPEAEEAVEARLLLADLAHRDSRLSEAIRWYEEAAGLAPERRSQLDYQVASCYEEGGDMTVAVHRYRAIDEAPWSVRGELAAARLFEREEQWAEAEKIYQALAREPVPEAKLAQERLAALRQQPTD